MDNIEGYPLETVLNDLLNKNTWETFLLRTKHEIIIYFNKITFEIMGLHENDVIHRDLTPRNIFVTPDDDIEIQLISSIEKSNYIISISGNLSDHNTD